jgi:LmbE family N-acetylglucosaminyl deacetylase
MLVISPHLDDAVLSCGELLAARPGAVVLTVFAGTPRDAARLTDWDARCGFRSAAEAMAVRRHEDDAALAVLGGAARRLSFCDAQYGETPTVEALVPALLALAHDLPDEPLLYPLGLFHSDHRLVHEAVRALLRERPSRAALAYEDVPYRSLPGVLQQRLAELGAQGVAATPADEARPDATTAQAKARALALYASQVRSFGPGGLDDATRPERLWRLDDAGAAA